ncbi:MAG: barnase inhibitor [Clostridiales bacterium]|nr:barnase inhibitor [Clostridiales bacterium]
MRPVYTVDCSKMQDRASAHDELARALQLPEYYGRNLDALYDCLMDLPECTVVLEHIGALEELGPYGEHVLDVFQDAAREREDLILEKEE